MIKKLFSKFSVFDLIIIACCAALGVAAKPLVAAAAQIITGPLMIPGGAFAGGIYMLFIVLGAGITQKPGSASLICIVQALLVIVTGVYGSHGVASILTYALPGIVVDLLWLLMGRHRGCCALCCFLGCIAANMTGVVLVNIVFFRLPLIPLLLTVALSAFSGGVGGIIVWHIIKRTRKLIK